jgi:hypothetical protein
MAQAVSRRPSNAKAWVRSPASSCGICGGKSGTGTGLRDVSRRPWGIWNDMRSETLVWSMSVNFLTSTQDRNLSTAYLLVEVETC